MNNIYRIPCPKTFNLSLCLDCGQAFRWTNKDKLWQGVAYGKYIEIEQTEKEIIFYNCTEDDFTNIWANYFDLQCDYEKIVSSYDDKHLELAVKEYDGIRILRQEPWKHFAHSLFHKTTTFQELKELLNVFVMNSVMVKWAKRPSHPLKSYQISLWKI